MARRIAVARTRDQHNSRTSTFRNDVFARRGARVAPTSAPLRLPGADARSRGRRRSAWSRGPPGSCAPSRSGRRMRASTRRRASTGHDRSRTAGSTRPLRDRRGRSAATATTPRACCTRRTSARARRPPRVARGDRAAPRGGQPAAADLAARRQLDLVGLVGGEAVEVGDVELGILVALGDLLEAVVERFVAGFERVVAVVAVDAEDEVLRRQPVVPVDDRDRAGVVVAEALRAAAAPRRRAWRRPPRTAGPDRRPEDAAESLRRRTDADRTTPRADITRSARLHRAFERGDHRAEPLAVELEPRRVHDEARWTPRRPCRPRRARSGAASRPICVMSTMRSHSPVERPELDRARQLDDLGGDAAARR